MSALHGREVVARLVAERGDLLVVSGLGNTTYDLGAAGDHPLNFYLWGAMGSAAMIGLGLALAQPTRRVLVVTGDGEQLMALGALATVAAQRPENFALVVIDNERYAETGMQPTHTGLGTDLAGVASACGFPVSREVADEAGLAELVTTTRTAKGPVFGLVKVAAERQKLFLPPRDGPYLKHRFREALLGAI